MTIQELKKILDRATDKTKKVYIESTNHFTTEIHWNFDDNNDLELSEGTNRE